MSTTDHTVDQPESPPTPPWWKRPSIAIAIGFPALLIASATFSGLLMFWIARELFMSEKPDLSDVWRAVEQSLAGCAVVGFLAGIAGGVPLGIVRALSMRERQLDLEQRMNENFPDHP